MTYTKIVGASAVVLAPALPVALPPMLASPAHAQFGFSRIVYDHVGVADDAIYINGSKNTLLRELIATKGGKLAFPVSYRNGGADGPDIQPSLAANLLFSNQLFIDGRKQARLCVVSRIRATPEKQRNS